MGVYYPNGNIGANTYYVGADESVQAAVDKAYDATVLETTPQYLRVDPLADWDCKFDPISGLPFLTDGTTIARGVFVLDYKNPFTQAPIPSVKGPPIALTIDDIRKMWMRTAAGLLADGVTSGALYAPTSHLVWIPAAGMSAGGKAEFYIVDLIQANKAATGYPGYLIDDYPIGYADHTMRMYKPAHGDAWGDTGVLASYATGTKDITGMTYLSAVITMHTAPTLNAGDLQIGLCDNATFATGGSDTDYFDLPALSNANTPVRVLIDISGKSVNSLKSIGTNVVTDVAASYVFTISDVRVASHPFIGISPLRYMAEHGIRATLAVLTPDTTANGTPGTADIMNLEDLYIAHNLFGCELANHQTGTVGTLDDFMTYNIGGKYGLACADIGEMGSTRFAHTRIGDPVKGYIESGAAHADFKITDFADTYGIYAQLIKRHYDWSRIMATISPIGARLPHFARNYCAESTAALAAISRQVAGSGQISSGIILLHYIAEVAGATPADTTISYAQWKTLIDNLSAAVLADRCSVVTMSAWTTATVGASSNWAYIEDGSMDRLTLGDLPTTGMSWVRSAGGTAVVTADIGEGGVGHQAIRVTGAAATVTVYTPHLGLAPGTYTVKARIKGSTAHARIVMALFTTNQAGVSNHDNGLPICIKEPTTSWQDVMGTFSITPDNKNALIQFYFTSAANGSTFDIDEVMISPGGTGALAPNNAIQTALPGTPTLTITGTGNDPGHARTVTVQLKDNLGGAPITAQFVRAWLSDTAAGVVGTAPGTATVSTGTVVQEVTSKLHWLAMTGATGILVLDITTAGHELTETYLNVEWLGKVTTSLAITFQGA